MRKLLTKLICLLLVIMSIAFLSVTIILKGLDRVYATEYPRVLVVKHDYMMQLSSPKVILVGDSNLAFGIDGAMLAQKTGYATANLGLHVGYGQKYMIQPSVANANAGDIIIISLSPDRWASGTFFGGQLTLASIGSRIDMYQYVPLEYWKQMFKELMPATKSMLKRASPQFNGAGDYKRAMFDDAGNNLLDRKACILAYPYTPDVYFSADTINMELIDYVNQFAQRMSEKQVAVVVAFSPVLDEAIVCSQKECLEFETALSDHLDVPVISTFGDYIYPREYIYDFAFHCTSEGEDIRTEQLAIDILQYIDKINSKQVTGG